MTAPCFIPEPGHLIQHIQKFQLLACAALSQGCRESALHKLTAELKPSLAVQAQHGFTELTWITRAHKGIASIPAEAVQPGAFLAHKRCLQGHGAEPP